MKRHKNSIKFVFMHIPKTGGTTFRRLVISKLNVKQFRDNEDRYNLNKASWYRDYFGITINYEPIFKDKEKIHKYDVVNGHFTASKYLFLKYPIITWVRNPIDRLVSHYYNWLLKYNKIDRYNDKEKLVWYKYFETGMDLVEFSKAFGNHMSFFFDIDFNKFKFVGILEHYNESLDILGKLFNVKLPVVNTICNHIDHPIPNKDIRDKICKNQKIDFELYRKCVDKFKSYKKVKYYASP